MTGSHRGIGFLNSVRTLRGLPWPDSGVGPKLSLVYFAESVGSERIKIGRSTDVEGRMRCLGACQPSPVRCLAVILGGKEEELRLHRLFAAHRVAGEWFVKCPEIMRIVRRHAPELRARLSLQHQEAPNMQATEADENIADDVGSIFERLSKCGYAVNPKATIEQLLSLQSEAARLLAIASINERKLVSKSKPAMAGQLRLIK